MFTRLLIILFIFILLPLKAYAAVTYFPAAGSGSCNWSSSSCWATTQGGAGSAGVPTNADTVDFEGAVGTNVFNLTVDTTTDTAKVFLGINQAGATNQPSLTFTSGQILTIAGSVTFVSSETLSGTGTLAISATSTVNTGGVTFPGNIYFTSNSTFTMASNITITGSMSTGNSAPTFAGAFNITTANLYFSTANQNNTLTFTAGQTLTVTNLITLIGNNNQISSGALTTYVGTVKSGTSSSPFYLNYTGPQANENITGITFTDVNASGSTLPLQDFQGPTGTRTVNIINTTPASQGIGQCSGSTVLNGVSIR